MQIKFTIEPSRAVQGDGVSHIVEARIMIGDRVVDTVAVTEVSQAMPGDDPLFAKAEKKRILNDAFVRWFRKHALHMAL